MGVIGPNSAARAPFHLLFLDSVWLDCTCQLQWSGDFAYFRQVGGIEVIHVLGLCRCCFCSRRLEKSLAMGPAYEMLTD